MRLVRKRHICENFSRGQRGWGCRYQVEINNKKFSVELSHPAGQEKYDALGMFYKKMEINNANCVIYVFDVSDKNSFEIGIKQKYNPKINAIKSSKNCLHVLVGNKLDLKYKRNVTYEEAESFANENSMKYFEVSVRTGENMNILFDYIHSELSKKL